MTTMRAVSTVTLRNERQRGFAKKLRYRELPTVAPAIFDNPHPGLDFLQAVAHMGAQSSTANPWLIQKAVFPLQEQTANATPAQIRQLMEMAVKKRAELSPRALMIMFGFARNLKTAVQIIDNISKAMLDEHILANNAPHYPSSFAFMLLQMTQKQTQTWPMFLQALRDGDRLAERAFSRLLDIWMVMQSTPVCVDCTRMKEEYDEDKLWALSGTYLFSDQARTFLPVPEEFALFGNVWMREHTGQVNASCTRWINIIQEFASTSDQYDAHARQMWEEIMRPSYDLRPNGHDIVSIGIPEMYDHGFRFIQLLPENNFPEARARIWLELPLTLQPVYREIRLASPAYIPQWPNAPKLDQDAGKFLHYLSVRALWAITTGQFQKYSAKKSGSPCGHSGSAIDDGRSIRPHYRELPEGQRATPYAIERCLKHHWREPMEGWTFVMNRDHDQRLLMMAKSAPNFKHPLFEMAEYALPATA